MTTKIHLTDGSGRWLDSDRPGAISYHELFTFGKDGHRVSKVTGLPESTQDLFKTEGGVYVLRTSPPRGQGDESVTLIPEADAKAWLEKNDRPETEAEKTDPTAHLEIL